MTESQRIRATTKQIVEMLIKGDYNAIESLTSGCRLNAIEISEAISEHSHSLINHWC